MVSPALVEWASSLQDPGQTPRQLSSRRAEARSGRTVLPVHRAAEPSWGREGGPGAMQAMRLQIWVLEGRSWCTSKARRTHPGAPPLCGQLRVAGESCACHGFHMLHEPGGPSPTYPSLEHSRISGGNLEHDHRAILVEQSKTVSSASCRTSKMGRSGSQATTGPQSARDPLVRGQAPLATFQGRGGGNNGVTRATAQGVDGRQQIQVEVMGEGASSGGDGRHPRSAPHPSCRHQYVRQPL